MTCGVQDRGCSHDVHRGWQMLKEPLSTLNKTGGWQGFFSSSYGGLHRVFLNANSGWSNTAQKLSVWVFLNVCGPGHHTLQSGPWANKDCSSILRSVGCTLRNHGHLWDQRWLELCWCWVYTCFSAYLLMTGSCNDSKTRLQLSWHLFTPRISTTISEEGKTDAVLVLPLKH